MRTKRDTERRDWIDSNLDNMLNNHVNEGEIVVALEWFGETKERLYDTAVTENGEVWLGLTRII